MKKIAIVSNNLKVGGIQKSLINLLNLLSKNEYEIDCYLYNSDNFFKDDISKKINIITLKHRWKWLKLIPFNIVNKTTKSRLKDKNYDVVIDFDGYQLDTALEVTLSKCKNKIIWIHSDLQKKYDYEYKYRILHFFNKKKYDYYDKIVFVSKGVIEPFCTLNHKTGDNNNYFVIPNYINSPDILHKSKEKCDLKVNSDIYNFISVGRLSYAKGYDLVLKYMYELQKYRQDFHFYLIGSGPEKSKLLMLVEKYNLKDKVTFLGNKSNPYKYMKLMDGFILRSRYEGQGIVLMEAKVLGLEIFIPKFLENYNEDIKGKKDILESLRKASKKNKQIDKLLDYNNKIVSKLYEIIDK